MHVASATRLTNPSRFFFEQLEDEAGDLAQKRALRTCSRSMSRPGASLLAAGALCQVRVVVFCQAAQRAQPALA